jgi:hypothetical protein
MMNLNELLKYNITHGNITPEAIAFSYITHKYKITNFKYAQVYNSKYKKSYPIYA